MEFLLGFFCCGVVFLFFFVLFFKKNDIQVSLRPISLCIEP